MKSLIQAICPYGIIILPLSNFYFTLGYYFNVRKAPSHMGEIIWEKDLYFGFRADEGHEMRVIEAHAMFEAVSNIINQGKAEELLYKRSE